MLQPISSINAPVSPASAEQWQDVLNQRLQTNLEFAAALGNPLLQSAFIEAAVNAKRSGKDFASRYFKAANEPQSFNRIQFRAWFREDVDFQWALADKFKQEIDEQKKISDNRELWEVVRRVPTLHQDQRPANEAITHIILSHTIGISIKEVIDRLAVERYVEQAPLAKSTHYIIGYDGVLYCLVPEKYRAWFAETATWEGHQDMSGRSIGIFLERADSEPLSAPQLKKLLALLADIKQRHKIPQQNFIAYADVCLMQEANFERNFPWKTLAEHGYGLYLSSSERANTLPKVLATLPENFNSIESLKKLGYDVARPGQAMRAFNEDYVNCSDTYLSSDSKLRLYILLQIIDWLERLGYKTEELGEVVRIFNQHFMTSEYSNNDNADELNESNINILYALVLEKERLAKEQRQAKGGFMTTAG